MLSQVEDEIISCFNNGGGVPYSSYKRFHEVMAEESYQTVVVALVDHTLSLVPNLIDKLKNGIKVLDIGCGKGKAVNVMADHFKHSEFYGYDLSQEAIEAAKKEAQMMGNSNAFFEDSLDSGTSRERPHDEYDDEYYMDAGIEPPRFLYYRQWRIEHSTDE